MAIMNDAPVRIQKKILVVEDDEIQSGRLLDSLQREGFLVTLAHNGKEGLTLSLREHPDMILLDIVMPKMDGLTFVKKIRRDEWGKNARIIILSNLDDEQVRAEAMSHDIFLYLIKAKNSLEEIMTAIKKQMR